MHIEKAKEIAKLLKKIDQVKFNIKFLKKEHPLDSLSISFYDCEIGDDCIISKKELVDLLTAGAIGYLESEIISLKEQLKKY